MKKTLGNGSRGKVGSRSGSRFPQISNGDDQQTDLNINQSANMGGSGQHGGSGAGSLNVLGVCSEQGKRPYQEDEYSIHFSLTTKGQGQIPAGSSSASNTHFFGLYDGHAGGKCSKFVSSNLPDVLMDDPLYSSNIAQALKRAYLTANEQFLKIAEKMKLHDGSTGITCVIRDNILTVANVGDCRALVISAGRAVQMSIDQKPTSVEEQKRIAQLGGTVVNCMGVARVNGVLAVSRAFGNRSLKQVIRPDAEITTRELQREDEYLVMASDGLWDVLRNKDVSDIVSQLSTYNCQHIAEELVHTALVRGSMDNVTCIVVKIDGCLAINKDKVKDSTVGIGSNNGMMNTSNVSSKGISKTMSSIDDFLNNTSGNLGDEGSIIGSWAHPNFGGGLSRGGRMGGPDNNNAVDLHGGGADDDDDNASYIQPVGNGSSYGGMSNFGKSGNNEKNSFHNSSINNGGGGGGQGGASRGLAVTDFLTASGRSFMNGGRMHVQTNNNGIAPGGANHSSSGSGMGFGGTLTGMGLQPPVASPIQSVSKRPSTVGSFKSQGFASNNSTGLSGFNNSIGNNVGGFSQNGGNIQNNPRSSSISPGQMLSASGNESFNFNGGNFSQGNGLSRQALSRQNMTSPISFDFNSFSSSSNNNVALQNQQAANNMARPGTTASYNSGGMFSGGANSGVSFVSGGNGNSNHSNNSSINNSSNSNNNSNSMTGGNFNSLPSSSVRAQIGSGGQMFSGSTQGGHGGGQGGHGAGQGQGGHGGLFTSGYAGIKKLSQQIQSRP